MKENRKNTPNVPNLRFPEFEDEWEAKKIEEIATVSSGGTPSRTKPNYWNGNIPWITTSLIDFNRIKTAEEFITEDGLSNSSAKLFPKGTILMAMYGQGKTRGKVGILDVEASTNQACAAMKIKNKFHVDFVFNYLAKDYEKIRNLANDGGQQNLSAGLIKSLKIKTPSLSEQIKLANFLAIVDERISTQNKIIEDYKLLKAGMMQKIFNREIKFKADNGEDFPNWDEKRMDEIGFFYYGKSAPKHSLSNEASTPCVRYGELYTRFNGRIDKVYSYTEIPKKNLKFSKGGEILIPRVGEDPLDFSKCSYLPLKDVAIGEMISVFNTEQYQPFIVAYIRAKLKYEFARVVEGGNVSNLYFRYLEKVKIKLPSLKEQQKIASTLLAIDKKIEIETDYIKKLKVQRKYLLQKLFI